MVEGVPKKEKVAIGPDFNGHVYREKTCNEEVMCRHGVKERNVEGVDLAKKNGNGVF